jgi:hypothetical protein
MFSLHGRLHGWFQNPLDTVITPAVSASASLPTEFRNEFHDYAACLTDCRLAASTLLTYNS